MLGRRLEQVVEEAQAPGGMAGLNMLRQREQAEAALPGVATEQTGMHAGRLAVARGLPLRPPLSTARPTRAG